jgi:hypothetical protein
LPARSVRLSRSDVVHLRLGVGAARFSETPFPSGSSWREMATKDVMETGFPYFRSVSMLVCTRSVVRSGEHCRRRPTRRSPQLMVSKAMNVPWASSFRFCSICSLPRSVVWQFVWDGDPGGSAQPGVSPLTRNC